MVTTERIIFEKKIYKKDSEESKMIDNKNQYQSENQSQIQNMNPNDYIFVKLRKATRDKPKVIAGATGAIVTSLGCLLSALENPATPKHMKAVIIGAIGYILLPLDLIPDFTPVIGYGDDLASAAGVVAAVGIYSDFSLEKLDAYIDQMES